MQTKKTLKLVIAALLAAMTCVATMVIKIPLTATGGYINLGDRIPLSSINFENLKKTATSTAFPAEKRKQYFGGVI